MYVCGMYVCVYVLYVCMAIHGHVRMLECFYAWIRMAMYVCWSFAYPIILPQHLATKKISMNCGKERAIYMKRFIPHDRSLNLSNSDEAMPFNSNV